MKGQICGKADGEVGQEYHTPSGRLTNSPVSFAHSWVLPSENCRDKSECCMKIESVKLEKQVIVDGKESKLRTIPVTIGFHCLPTGKSTKLNIYDKSVDLRETAEDHLVCRCTEQCLISLSSLPQTQFSFISPIF
uniref:VWFD domain-containing protein n=1 Tax=Oncorhynchus tshawytscha TaxID=74940 RepID=A0A8C8JNT3_ONCTS